MATKKFHDFTPDKNFTKLLHDYSGNVVNGVGENQKRRPSMVWWAPDPASAPFGEAQKWFYSREQPDEEMLELRKCLRTHLLPALRVLDEQSSVAPDPYHLLMVLNHHLPS